MAIIKDTFLDESGKPVVVRIQVADQLEEEIFEEYDEESEEIEERPTRSGSVIIERATNTFKESLQLIQTCATQISRAVHEVPPKFRPKEFEVQFAVKLDGKVGAFIAESTVGAQLQVKLKWGAQDDEDAEE